MLFQHTWKAVIEQRKWQTRRLVVPRTVQPMFYDLKAGTSTPTDTGETDGDWFYGNTVWHAKPCQRGKGYMGLSYTEAKPKYRIGSTYAVQPGRGMSAIWWRQSGSALEYAHECYDLEDPGKTDLSDYDLLDGDAKQLYRQGYQEARIKLLSIRCEDVRGIGEADVIAEGFSNRGAFFDVWLSMHDKPAAAVYSSHAIIPDARNYLWTRPAEHYQAWVLAYELVRE